MFAAECWWTARSASGAAVREAVRRQYGRGRRPALRELDRRQKRQALAVGTLGEMRRRLEGQAPAGGAAHPTLAAIRARYAKPTEALVSP